MSTLDIPRPIKDISCQELLRYDDIIKHGTLRLRNSVSKLFDTVARRTAANVGFKWPRVYVVLRGACVYIFSNEMSKTVEKASSLYGFSLASTCMEEVAGSKVSWPFKVSRDLDIDEKAFYFSAPSQVDMQSWIDVINEQIERAYSGRNPASRGVFQETSSPQNPISSRARQLLPEEIDSLSYDTCTTSVGNVSSDDSDYEKVAEDNTTDDTKSHNKSPAVTPHIHGAAPKKLSANMLQSFDSPGAARNPLQKPAIQPKPGSNALVNELKLRAKISTTSLAVTTGDDSSIATENVLKLTRDYLPEPDDTVPEYFAPVEYVSGEDYVDCQHISPTIKSSNSDILAEKAFWSKSPEAGEQLMRNLTVDGAYMLRDSKDSLSQTLLVRTESVVRKFRINKNEDKKFSMVPDGPWFVTTSDLIAHYTTKSLPKLTHKLTKPWSEVSTGR